MLTSVEYRIPSSPFAYSVCVCIYTYIILYNHKFFATRLVHVPIHVNYEMLVRTVDLLKAVARFLILSMSTGMGGGGAIYIYRKQGTNLNAWVQAYYHIRWGMHIALQAYESWANWHASLRNSPTSLEHLEIILQSWMSLHASLTIASWWLPRTHMLVALVQCEFLPYITLLSRHERGLWAHDNV